MVLQDFTATGEALRRQHIDLAFELGGWQHQNSPSLQVGLRACLKRLAAGQQPHALGALAPFHGC